MQEALVEARSWLERLLRLGPPAEPTRAWAGALFSQAALSFYVGDVVAAHAPAGAEEVEQAAVPVAARLGDRVDHRAGEAAILCGRAQPLELVLLHHVVVV